MNNVTEIKRAEEQLDWVGGDEVVSLPEPTAPTAPRIATLSSSAMLVTLGLGEWGTDRQDKEESAKVTAANGSDKDAAKVYKNIMKGNATVKTLKNMTKSIRDEHTRLTRAWETKGTRILPTTNYFEYKDRVTNMIAERNKLADTFCNDEYDFITIPIKASLGGLYDESLYPPAHVVRAKYWDEMSISPIPESGHFVAELFNNAQSELDSMRADFEVYTQKKLQRAANETWKELRPVVANMSKMLDYDDGEKKTGFKDTLVTNVLDVLKIMRACNLSNDVRMTSIADKLETALYGVTPDALRNSGALRAKTKQQVDEAIAQLPTLDLF